MLFLIPAMQSSDTVLMYLLVILPVFSAFFTIFIIIGPSNFRQACKTVLKCLTYAVLDFLPVLALTITTLFVSLHALYIFLACYSVYVDHDCWDIAPPDSEFRYETRWANHTVKLIADTHIGLTTFPGPCVFIFGFSGSVTLLFAFIYNRREYGNDIRCRVAERLASKRETAKAQHTIQRSAKQLADSDASLVCLICVDRLTQPYTLAPCGHTFDLECLQGWFRTAHPSPTDEQLALTLDPRGSLYALRRQKFCPLCHAEVADCPAPARGLLGLGMEPPEEGNPWRGLFVNMAPSSMAV
ncbi:hypothetical protein B0H13DRAFT_1158596 [Mycena leptocephala]|nr:hypothetical protein B0H13DRAFT_1158596 [Mycena leptocephala]